MKTGINRNTYKLVVAAGLIVFSVVFLLAVGLITYQNRQDNRIRSAQVRACEKLGNPRARQITRNGEVLGELLATAQATREKTARLETGEQSRIDRQTARRYKVLATRLAPVPIADCEAIYPKP